MGKAIGVEGHKEAPLSHVVWPFSHSPRPAVERDLRRKALLFRILHRSQSRIPETSDGGLGRRNRRLWVLWICFGADDGARRRLISARVSEPASSHPSTSTDPSAQLPLHALSSTTTLDQRRPTIATSGCPSAHARSRRRHLALDRARCPSCHCRRGSCD